MKMTTKTQTTKTITPQVPTIVFDDKGLISILLHINMSKFAEVTAITEPKINKSKKVEKDGKIEKVLNTKFFGIEKISKMNVNFGGIYKNAVEKKMEKEGIEGDYTPAPLSWGQHYRDSRVIIEHKGNFYAQLRPLRADFVSYRWAENKEDMTEEEIKEMKTFFPKKKEGTRQPSKDKVIIRTIKISNIREIRMNKTRYQRGS
jgi:hypothetical protein